MTRHGPPPIGRNEVVSGAASPETKTNQNEFLYWTEVLAGQTPLYTDGDALSMRGHNFASRTSWLKSLPRFNPKQIHLPSRALRPRLSPGGFYLCRPLYPLHHLQPTLSEQRSSDHG